MRPEISPQLLDHPKKPAGWSKMTRNGDRQGEDEKWPTTTLNECSVEPNAKNWAISSWQNSATALWRGVRLYRPNEVKMCPRRSVRRKLNCFPYENRGSKEWRARQNSHNNPAEVTVANACSTCGLDVAEAIHLCLLRRQWRTFRWDGQSDRKFTPRSIRRDLTTSHFRPVRKVTLYSIWRRTLLLLSSFEAASAEVQPASGCLVVTGEYFFRKYSCLLCSRSSRLHTSLG